MKSLYSFLFSLLALVTTGGAAEIPNIRVEVRMVDVPEKQALRLIPKLLRRDQSGAACAEIEQLIARGQARLVEWPFLTMRLGSRSVVETTQEYRYAGSFTPPQAIFTQGTETKESHKSENPPWDLTVFHAMPAEMETRNLGVSLEVEPVLTSDGKTIRLMLVAQRTLLLRLNKMPVERPATGSKLVVEQPEIISFRVTGTFFIRNGESMLLGTFRTFTPAGDVELFIAKAEVIPND